MTELIAVTTNETVLAKLAGVARDAGLSFTAAGSIGDALGRGEPSAIVLDLSLDGAVEGAAAIRTRWATAMIAGFVSLPDRALWESARDAGYDLVATRGAVAGQLREALAAWSGPTRAARIRVAEAADVVGRLGAVARLEGPEGPVALYRIGGRLLAAGDVCPHAGARLSEGEIEGTVVTCPRHGSRFDLATGERVRGPADEGIPTFPVVEEDGAIFIRVD